MPDSLNLKEGTYLELLKEGMPGRQHKATPPEPVKEELFALGAIALATYVAARFASEVIGEAGRAYKKYLTAAGMKCQSASKKTPIHKRRKVYEACMSNARIVAEKSKLATMVSAKAKCSKTKEPQKCILKMGELIRKQQAQVIKAQEMAKKSHVTFGQGKFSDD